MSRPYKHEKYIEADLSFYIAPSMKNISTTTGSKDLQMVSITLRVLSRPDVEHLPKIYQQLGTDYDERVLPSIGNEVLKAIVAQFDAAELITQRELVSSLPPLIPLKLHLYITSPP